MLNTDIRNYKGTISSCKPNSDWICFTFSKIPPKSVLDLGEIVGRHIPSFIPGNHMPSWAAPEYTTHLCANPAKEAQDAWIDADAHSDMISQLSELITGV